ncbi:response regulator [Desulfogranum marinum]|uniref:response regulator n=1 Tax=Desulfogranum marinum TaxID=453220 RepID=UPI0019665D03|nr:response regulator [Desulfogranum marinum]MBM9512554.1 response regulator [Desulfogranum marinum]
MHEIEALSWQQERYRAILSQHIDRLYNALEELQRTTLLCMSLDTASDKQIDEWLQQEGFAVDENGFFQSKPLLSSFRQGTAPKEAFSISWGKQLKSDPTVRRHIHTHRNIGNHLKHIHDRLGNVGWIYYQDAANTSLQYPFIDQCTAIPFDFDWTTYHTYLSVCPQNNPKRLIRWTTPTVDYAGEGIILSVSIPVWQGDSFIGLWSIDLPIRYIYQDFASAKPFPQQKQFIVNKQGMLLLHEKLDAEIDKTEGTVFLHPLSDLGKQWQDLDLAELIVKQAGVLQITNSAGTNWVYSYSHVPGVDWILFSGLPKVAVEEAATQRLQEAFRQISDGDFSHRIEAMPTSTLSTLVDEFNNMTTRLDVAEKHRQEMERQLLQSQKMEAVGRLAGGVAHDYNNMLSVIIGYSEMVLEKTPADNPLYHYIKKIESAANRSKELTRQLLAFARCQTIAPKILNINEAVQSMLKMVNPLIGEDIKLAWCPGEEIWPIKIDPTQIDQILANLCVNAKDAMNGMGKIIIATANTKFDDHFCSQHQGFFPGEFVRLSLSDDGEGMEASILDHLFEPFFSTKDSGKGTGLGLATVYGIVKQNNGFINVNSDLGIGTTFEIYLPRANGQPVETLAKSTVETSRGNNETVLLVEDEAAILNLTKRMLRQLGYHVIATDSPMEAISIVESHAEPIDLLLTDVIMPELNGRDLANRLQQNNPALNVLFMSGYPSSVIINRGVLDNDVFLLQKPFSKSELATKIREALATSISLS